MSRPRQFVTLNREEVARARALVRRLEGVEAARAFGLYSPVTLFRALARWPVAPLTARTIRERLEALGTGRGPAL